MKWLLLITRTIFSFGCGQNKAFKSEKIKLTVPSSDTTIAFTANDMFIKAKMQLETLAKDGAEWTISFGKDTSNGAIIFSAPQSIGEENSGQINTSITGYFSDLHNHPGYSGPSAGDIYGLIKLHGRHPDFNLRFVVTKNGGCFAITITDTSLAASFLKNYPPEVKNNIPSFPEKVLDDYRRIYGLAKYDTNIQNADALGIAYVLSKYQSGICLLRHKKDDIWEKITYTK